MKVTRMSKVTFEFLFMHVVRHKIMKRTVAQPITRQDTKHPNMAFSSGSRIDQNRFVPCSPHMTFSLCPEICAVSAGFCLHASHSAGAPFHESKNKFARRNS